MQEQRENQATGAEGITVSVVIPTYNRPDAALRCARSALASDFTGGIEVVIVDDCSANCIIADEVTRALPDETRIRVIRHARNMNTAAAHNTGGHAAHGRYILFLDDDNELRPDALRRLVAVLDAGAYGVAAPLAVNALPSGEKLVWASSFAFNPWTSVPKNADANAPYTPAYAAAMAGRVIDTWYSPNGYMMAKDLFERLNGFCAWFGMYMEESDICLRARELGARSCIVGDAVTWHRHYNDMGDMVMRRFATNTPRKAFLLSRNRLPFAWRHYTAAQALSVTFIFAPIIAARYFLLALVRGWPKIGLAFLAGHLAGLVHVARGTLARKSRKSATRAGQSQRVRSAAT